MVQLIKTTALLLIISLTLYPYQIAAEVKSDSFSPTWKLLSAEEKGQFISGYIQGWKDAATVTDIAIDYVEKNPAEAVGGLKKVKVLYDMEGIDPSVAVSFIDSFYANPDNSKAPLSKAVSFAKGQLQ